MKQLILSAAVGAVVLVGGAERLNQMTLQNSNGQIVVCKPPSAVDSPEFSESGRSSMVQWCFAACYAHGFMPTRKSDEDPEMTTDLEYGTIERHAAEKYLPPQCLPFNPGPMGLVRKDGRIPDCMGVLFLGGKCPE